MNDTARQVLIRPAAPSDQPFVAATMSKQLAHVHADANAIVDRILDSASTRILIAERGNRIVGWLACSKIPGVRAVLFVYVRREYRGQGIARALTHTAWPTQRGQWMHGGLCGSTSKSLLERHFAVAMPIEDLI